MEFLQVSDMKANNIALVFVLMFSVIGWNVFLAIRDAELFRAIETRNAQIEQVRTH